MKRPVRPRKLARLRAVAAGSRLRASRKVLGAQAWPSSVVMLTTVVVVVWTHDLAQGVLAGVLLSGLFFAGKVKRLFTVTSRLSADGRTRTYHVAGQVFFASAERFADAFDFKEVLDRVVIDVSAAHFWDISAVGVLDKTILKFRREGAAVEIVGLNEESAVLVHRFATHDKETDALPAAH